MDAGQLSDSTLGDAARVYDGWVDYDGAIQTAADIGMGLAALVLALCALFFSRRRGKEGRAAFLCFQGQGSDFEFEHHLL